MVKDTSILYHISKIRIFETSVIVTIVRAYKKIGTIVNRKE